MHRLWLWLLPCLYLFLCLSAKGQEEPSSGIGNLLAFPSRISGDLSRKQERVVRQLNRQTDRYFRKLLRQENKLIKRLSQTDSNLVHTLQLGNDSLYNEWQKASRNNSLVKAAGINYYSGSIDSLQTGLRFLNDQKLLSNVSQQQYQQLLMQYAHTKNTLNSAAYLQQQVETRKELLKQYLANLPLGKALKKYQAQCYYYTQQVSEYQRVLQQPDQWAGKAIDLLSRLPAFQKYFDRFSELGGMFFLPGQAQGTDPAVLLGGLQTRQQVMTDLTSRLGGSSAAQQAITNGFEQGQQQLTSVKEKLSRVLEQGGGDPDLPGFRPNTEKRKTVWKRIQPGFNMQSVRGNSLFPITSDIALDIGYKLNSRSVVGAAISYKIGWGESIRKITITSEGIGLRTYLDAQLKGNIWLSGGMEWNYRNRLKNLAVLKTIQTWQQSALIGVQKRMKVKKYTTTVSLLFDAFYNRNIPHTQPLLFRVGYKL